MAGSQLQQQPQCEECGQEKLPEEISLTDSSGSQTSEKTGWSAKVTLSTPLEYLGLGGASSESQATFKKTEAENTNNAFTEKKTFLLCSNLDCDAHTEGVIEIVGWKHRVHPDKEYSPDNVREEAKERLKTEKEITDIEMDLSSEEKSATNKTEDTGSATSTSNTQTDTDTATTESQNRIKQWWGNNRVRQWVSRRFDDDTTDTTDEESDETTTTQSTLGDQESETDKNFSQGNIGADAANDYATDSAASNSKDSSL